MARLLITGATGHLGRQLTAHFVAIGHEVVEMGTRPLHPGVIIADLSRWDGEWVRHFAGVDCVLHLAACPRPDAGWNEIQAGNLDLTGNVFEAAAQQGVGRIVFASSNWVVAGHRFDDAWLDSAIEPAPVNAYGMSKLAGERLGKLYSAARGLSVICLRIGFNQQRPGNAPGDHMSSGLWGQQMWLSDQDMREGFERAAFAPADLGFAVVNLVSRNGGARWDLAEAKALIGYEPRDGHTPVLSPELRAREETARSLRSTIEENAATLAKERL